MKMTNLFTLDCKQYASDPGLNNFVYACTKAEENENFESLANDTHIDTVGYFEQSLFLEDNLLDNKTGLFSFYHFNNNCLVFYMYSHHLHVISHTNKLNRIMTSKHF